jgi:hypothetical protein
VHSFYCYLSLGSTDDDGDAVGIGPALAARDRLSASATANIDPVGKLAIAELLRLSVVLEIHGHGQIVSIFDTF